MAFDHFRHCLLGGLHGGVRWARVLKRRGLLDVLAMCDSRLSLGLLLPGNLCIVFGVQLVVNVSSILAVLYGSWLGD